MPNLIEILFRASGSTAVAGESDKIVSELTDVSKITAKLQEQMAAKGKSDQFVKNIQQQLAGQGLDVKAKDISAAINAVNKEAAAMAGPPTSGVKSFVGGMKELDTTMASLGLGMGLMSLVTSTKAWVEESVAGAAAEARLTRTFTNIAGGSANATAMLEAMTTATKRQVDQGELMAVGMDVINLGLAKSPAQMEQYVAVSKRLGAEFGNMGFDEAVAGFNRVMESGSISARFLLNYGISADNVKARVKELQQANNSLSDTDATRQALMAEAVATYERLGPVQRDVISAQKELTAAQKDFQDAFGAMLLTIGGSTGVFDTATAAFRQMEAGAQAWPGIFRDSIPAIMEHSQLLRILSNDYLALQFAVLDPAKAIAYLKQATTEATDADARLHQALLEIKMGLGATSSDVGVYTAKTGGATAATGQFGASVKAAAIDMSKWIPIIDAATVRADAARVRFQKLAQQGFQLDLGALYDANAASEVADAQRRQTRIANIQTISQFEISERERVEKEGAKFAEDAQKEQERRTEEAYDNMRSVVESVMQPTLSEVYKPPPGFEQRIDESARRLADVANLGGKSPWADVLMKQYAGQGWWQPMADAIASGNRDAMANAASTILANPADVTMMWDVPMIVQKVKDQLAAQNARKQIMDVVMAELSGQGIAVNAGEVTAAMGGGGIAGAITGNLGADMSAAVATSGASSALVASIRDGVAKDEKNMLALANTFAGGFEKALPAAMKMSGQAFINALAASIAGLTKGGPAAAAPPAGGARP